MLPCNTGECLKIIRLENGSLAELVTCFLELTRGKSIQAGSVIMLFSTAHLQMRGVAGYMADLCGELNRIHSVFKGGGGWYPFQVCQFCLVGVMTHLWSDPFWNQETDLGLLVGQSSGTLGDRLTGNCLLGQGWALFH